MKSRWTASRLLAPTICILIWNHRPSCSPACLCVRLWWGPRNVYCGSHCRGVTHTELGCYRPPTCTCLCTQCCQGGPTTGWWEGGHQHHVRCQGKVWGNIVWSPCLPHRDPTSLPCSCRHPFLHHLPRTTTLERERMLRYKIKVRKVLKDSFFSDRMLAVCMLANLLKAWYSHTWRSADLEAVQGKRTIGEVQELQSMFCFRPPRLIRKVRAESSLALNWTIYSRRLCCGGWKGILKTESTCPVAFIQVLESCLFAYVFDGNLEVITLLEI